MAWTHETFALTTASQLAWRLHPASRLREPVGVTWFGNIDSRTIGAIFIAAAIAYLAIYALEAPIRYVLFLIGKDDLILLRDGLIFGPLALLFAAQMLRLRLHPAFLIFGALLVFHALVLVGTVGSVAGAAYGVKVVVNLIFGFFVASLLISPSSGIVRFLAAIWCVTILGLCLDKFAVTFPWSGIKTIVGDLNVDVSKDWDIQDPLARRVAGFTRSSISAAALLPPLAIILLGRTKHWALRAALILGTLGAVFLTTQKGSLLAFAPIAAILCLPATRQLKFMRLACLGFILAAVALPILASNLQIDHGTGVYSTESIFLRMDQTWPDAWKWIAQHGLLGFGVGLGGIGGPQRLYAPDWFNPADNIFILLYAYFGVLAIPYLGMVCYLVLRPIKAAPEGAVTAIAVVAFAFGYGAVLSIIEDQSAALFLGAALGALWCETRVSWQAEAKPILNRWRPTS